MLIDEEHRSSRERRRLVNTAVDRKYNALFCD